MTERTWPALDVERPKRSAVEGPDLLQAALIDYRVAAIDETPPDMWRVFFSSAAERDRAAGDIARQFPDVSTQPVDVADEDWVARSQADLRAVRVGNIIVAPTAAGAGSSQAALASADATGRPVRARWNARRAGVREAAGTL